MKLVTLRAALVVALLALSAGVPDAQAPQSAWRASSDVRAALWFRAAATGSNRTYTHRLTGTMGLTGDYLGFAFTPGFDGRGDLCADSVQMSMSPADATGGAASWFIEGRLVSLQQDRATIDLRWTRHVNRAGLTPNETFTSEQRLVLRDGDHGILDMLRSTSPSASGCDSFGITYELRLDGPEELSRAAIGYDLWLVQQDGDGQIMTERFQATVRQSEQVDYFFVPFGYGKDGSRVAGHSEIEMNVWGTVRGRVRRDGDIDLTVEGTRGFYDHGGSIASTGRTLMTVKPGETIEVPLDLPIGSLAKVGDLASVFGSHRTAVRITARRRW